MRLLFNRTFVLYQREMGNVCLTDIVVYYQIGNQDVYQSNLVDFRNDLFLLLRYLSSYSIIFYERKKIYISHVHM